MKTPITTLVKQRKSSKFPVNQEVTMKADGSGGPVSVAKQTTYEFQSEPENKKQYKQRLKQYKEDPYQKAVDKFPQFNRETDTIISTTSGNLNINKQINLAKAQNAATHLYDNNTSKNYVVSNIKAPTDSKSYREPGGKTTTYDLHNKENLKGSVKSVAKKKDACYAKVKSRYKKWPSAYASGALVKCREVGAANWGDSSPAKQTKPPRSTDKLYIKAKKLQDKSDAKAYKAAIAVDEGRDRKADRLYKRAARLENRGIKIEERAAKRRKKI